MRRVKEAIVVEGKHDVIRVRAAVEAVVVQTGGFRIFRQPEQLQMMKSLAASRGLIILTDSDSAGMLIRNHLLGTIPAEQIKNAYIPPIPGKERRKAAPSAEGLLGVEGVDTDVVLAALERAGATFEDTTAPTANKMNLTKADLVAVGLSGGPDSVAKRLKVLETLGLPGYLSANRLLEVVNATVTPEEWHRLLDQVDRA